MLESTQPDNEGEEAIGKEGDLAMAMVTDDFGNPNEPNREEADIDRKKHSKKAGAVSPSLGSAGSMERPVRSQ
jgi:hypothetical protein